MKVKKSQAPLLTGIFILLVTSLTGWGVSTALGGEADAAQAEGFFLDVDEGFWAYSYISDLFDDGYVAGCSTEPLLYCAGMGMNRAEGSVFVVRGDQGADFLPLEPSVPPFADVPLHEWFAKWVNELKESGFTSGCGTNDQGEEIFCPYDIHTRAEAAVFFYRMVKGQDIVPPSPDPNREFKYDDVSADDSYWFNKWIYAAYDEGIVGDCEDPANLADNLFRPNDEILREEAACMMHHAIYGVAPPTPTPTTPTPTPVTPTPVTPTATPNPDGALRLGQEIKIGNGTSPDIAVDRQGNLHIVYDADSGGITYVKYTTQGMGTPVQFGGGSQPRVAIDNQDNPHIIYIADGDDVTYTKMQNGSFISPVLVYDYPDRTEKPRIAIDKRNNTAFVMYEHVGEKEGSDPETAWVFYYHIIDNSGVTPVIGPRIHPPTDRSSGYVEQAAAVVYDTSGTAHYFWRDWGDRGGSRGLHYQTLSSSGQYGPDYVVYGSVSDFSDVSIDPANNLHVISTTGWATEGLVYATNKSGWWTTQTHFREYFADEAGNLVFDPDHNVPAIAYDPGRGLAYIAFSGGETEINHSYANIDSYIAYVDGSGNFSNAALLHDENRASGGKYNGVRIAAARNGGVFAVVPLLRQGSSNSWEIVLQSVGGAQVGQ
jgi:hypothetical protein